MKYLIDVYFMIGDKNLISTNAIIDIRQIKGFSVNFVLHFPDEDHYIYVSIVSQNSIILYLCLIYYYY